MAARLHAFHGITGAAFFLIIACAPVAPPSRLALPGHPAAERLPAPLAPRAQAAPLINGGPVDGGPIDAIVVHKAARTLELYASGRLVGRIDHIQLGGQPLGPKHFQGDQRTPEGHYTIDGDNPQSRYDVSLHISYPAPADIAYALAAGRHPGGEIFIHGQPNDWDGGRRHLARVPGDWTDGCIALANAEMEMLWRRVPDGTPIDIEP